MFRFRHFLRDILFVPKVSCGIAEKGEEAARVVNMASISIQDQAALVANSVVLLTNHGGGGHLSSGRCKRHCLLP